jgi:4-hydroxy-2-oxoheptanedioate aldolase
MEHSPRGFDRVENMVRAADLVGVTSIVRVPSGAETEINRALETGAQGIVLRMLESADQVAAAREFMLYPPAGRRGTCSASRAARYSSLRPRFGEYLRESNQDTLLVGLIESPDGVARADQIIQAGLDVVVVGRGDLSASLGVPAQNRHPDVLAMAARVAKAANASKATVFGSTTSSSEETADLISQGCRVFIHRDDTSLLLESLTTATEQLRRADANVGSSVP